ncbi:hypothetical protein AYO44_00790 [Planctomycetaceae bacterium SCGC AG-212-F19]|nr:hypothetical protein AYO44_00790 [Planctomycetaceae bacterium SCGC AG-212-F19]
MRLPSAKEPPTARHKHHPAKIDEEPAPTDSAAPELLRRGLLGMVTALIVARPLLPGEDPGRLLPTTGTAGMVITLLWLLAALGWAAWRAWGRQTPLRISHVEPALLLGGVLLFVSSTFSASYRHPAWLVSWEWLALLAAFWLVRQLPASAEENRALIAVVLATAVCLAAQGVYQGFQPPRTAPPDPTLSHIYALDLEGPAPPGPDRRLIRGTFADSGVFATFLVLAAPALVIACYLVLRANRPRWQLALTALAAGMVFLALGMAQWWPAIAALLVVAVLLLIAARPLIPQRTFAWSLAGLVGVLVLLVATVWWGDFLAVGDSRSTMAGNTFAMLGGRWLLGAGPGNFARLYPIFVDSPAMDRVAHPSNFLVEALALGGLLTFAALLYGLVSFFRKVGPEIPIAFRTPPTEDESAHRGQPRWECYVGGVIGLTGGFVLQIGGQSPAELIHLAGISAGRSLLWLGAFALFEAIPWTAGARVTALTSGVTAALLCLLVTGGFFYPSLAQPLWIMAALALNAVPEAPATAWGGRFVRLVPVPVLAVVWWLYLLIAFVPVAGAARHATLARMAYPVWRERIEPRWLKALAMSTQAKAEMKAGEDADHFLREYILGQLEAAGEFDPSDSGLRAELAYWYGKGWEVLAWVPNRPGSVEQMTMRGKMNEYSEQAMAQLQRAQEPDPFGKPAFWMAQEVRMRFADVPRLPKEERGRQRTYAVNALRSMIAADPSNPRLRYRVAEIMHENTDPAMVQLWRQEAERALKLEDDFGATPRRLTNEERKQLRSWLAEKVQTESIATPAPSEPMR